MHPLFAFGMEIFSPMHILLLLIVGILLFGKRLPEVGRSLGKGIVEFKKGLKGLEDEFEGATSTHADRAPALEPPRPPQRIVATTPKFEENPGAPPTPPQV